MRYSIYAASTCSIIGTTYMYMYMYNSTKNLHDYIFTNLAYHTTSSTVFNNPSRAQFRSRNVWYNWQITLPNNCSSGFWEAGVKAKCIGKQLIPHPQQQRRRGQRTCPACDVRDVMTYTHMQCTAPRCLAIADALRSLRAAKSPVF